MSSSESPTVLVTAGSGNIGRRLIPLLLADSSRPKVVLPTSNGNRLSGSLPPDPHSQLLVEQGNIQDPRWFEQILRRHSVSSVFLCLTGENELMVTLNSFDAMIRAGCVRHLVYLSACGDFSLPTAIDGGGLVNVSAGHVVVKYIIEGKLRYGMSTDVSNPPFTYTIIGPSLFFDNDLRSKNNILDHGFFDEPLGSKGVSRVKPSDIALAAYKSLIIDCGGQYHGQKIMVGSLETYDATATESLWSKHLGKPVKVARSDMEGLDAFEEHFGSKRGLVFARDMRLMYETFEAKRFGMSKEEYETQVAFLGKRPDSYEHFVAKTARSWLEGGNVVGT